MRFSPFFCLFMLVVVISFCLFVSSVFGQVEVFGYNVIGGSKVEIESTWVWFSKATLDDNALLSVISAYVNGSSYLQCGVYNDSSGVPSVLLGLTNIVPVPSTPNWVNLTINLELVAGDYWFALMTNSSYMSVYHDVGSANQRYARVDVTWGSFPNPALAGYNEAQVTSVYGIYDVVVDATPTPSPTLTPITSGELNNSMLFVLGFMVVLCVVGLVWLNRVPVVVLLVGLFAVLVGLYCVLGGVYGLGVGQGWFALFTVVFGGLTMLLVGLGVRVRR